MQYATRNARLSPKTTPNFCWRTRKSFMLASKAPTGGDIAGYAAMGRDYLELAHQAAKVDARLPIPSIWDLP